MVGTSPRIQYLGPEGTFSHNAALLLAPTAGLEAVADAQAVITAVQAGAVAGGVVAFENSFDGTVTRNVDALLHSAENVLIAGECILPVSFDLYRRQSDQLSLRRVIGHPVALAQVGILLEDANAATVEASSNVAALTDLLASDEPGIGAVGPSGQLSPFSGLRVEAEHVEDSPAATRFVLLKHSCPPPTGHDLTAFVLHPDRDAAGSLVRLLEHFSARNLNLTAIRSRPSRLELGDYLFFLECQGHLLDAPVRDAFIGLMRSGAELRFLGSFPADPGRRFSESPPDDPATAAYYRFRTLIDS
jgi:prephenate dehydratase